MRSLCARSGSLRLPVLLLTILLAAVRPSNAATPPAAAAPPPAAAATRPSSAAPTLAAATPPIAAAGEPAIPAPAAESESLRALRELAETRNYSLGRPVKATPVPDGSAVLFLRGGPRDPVLGLYELSVKTGEVRELADPRRILEGKDELLSAQEKARRERQRITTRGFASFEVSNDGAQVLVSLAGQLYVVRRADGSARRLPGEGWIGPAFSPDGTCVAATREDDLYSIEIAAGSVTRLTTGATETLTHGVAEFVAQEEMDRQEGFWWSPDSRRIVYQQTDLSPVGTFWIADPGDPSSEPEPYRYPLAGTPNAKVRLGIVPRGGGPTVWVRWDAERFPYLARVIWEEEGAPLTLLVQERSQRGERLLTVDPQTGDTRELLTETDDAWLNLDGDTKIPRWLPDGSAFVWSTERRGDWQLELRGRQGELIRALTPVGFHYAGVADLDAKARIVRVLGGPDSRETHLYRVSLDGGDPVRISEGAGIHSAVFSKNHGMWVDAFSLLEGRRGVEARSAAGKLLASLPSVAQNPARLPNLELTRVTSEGRTFDALVVRPASFAPGRRYPVLLDVYAGPTAKVVRASALAYLDQQWMADRGYIVVSLDGRGTPGQGRAWERAVAGDLIDIPLEDQIGGLRALGARYAEMDLSRVGVTGWSFGGYVAAMATIRHPDVFRCGVAGAPLSDWRNYDTHYTERYMRLPSDNPEGYKKASVLSWADRLERPLLLVHGLTDDNVYFLNTFQIATALFMAGKPYELLTIPGTHMVYDPGITIGLNSRIMKFFDACLKEPPAPERN